MPGNRRGDIYQVQLPVFEGPLDLLLQLIEREKLDISAVSVAQVADQFLDHIRQLGEVKADVLADFLVMAVRLVWIKSRLLLPRPPEPAEEEEEDPAEALARQLQEYKRFKEAANVLRALEEQGLHTYLRLAPPPKLERRLEAGGVSLAELLAAAQSAFRSLAEAQPPALPNGMVVPFSLTIEDQICRIRTATANGNRISFRSLLGQAHHRLEIIVTLLAVLELIKRRQITVTQERPFGEILIAPTEMIGQPDAADTEAPEE
ncbi:MAG: segregation and condensation protein A [Anaerolineae bacterium]